MNIRNARKLHNGDQVKVKDSGEICEVISTTTMVLSNREFIVITMMTKDGFASMTHLEIE